MRYVINSRPCAIYILEIIIEILTWHQRKDEVIIYNWVYVYLNKQCLRQIIDYCFFIFVLMSDLTQFEQTLLALQQRVRFFETHHTSAQNQLTYTTSNIYTVRSLAQIYPSLKNYSLYDTPLNPQLSDIYSSNPDNIRFLLPPPSEGENSINQEQSFEPSFKWLSSTLIDSTLLVCDQIQPKKVEKGCLPPDWQNVTELLIFNIKQKLYLKSELKEAIDYVYQKFEMFPWIKIKRVKEIYSKGKPSILIRFGQTLSACFAYFNLVKSQNRKQFFGENCQVFRVTDNRLKSKPQKWVGLIFRKIPTNLTKQSFLNIFKKNQLKVIWIEELAQISDYKYTLCRVNYLEQAIAICNFFQTKKPIKDIKVNLHPKSSKIWQNAQQNSIEAAITNS